MRLKNIKQQAGVTLVEILVTVVILAVGLLGLAALQTTSLKLSYDSFLRTQAEFLAYDLVDRIRSNPTEAASYTVSTILSAPSENCYSNLCSTGQLRLSDLYQWQIQIANLLPSLDGTAPTGVLTYDATSELHTLTLEWEDRYEVDVNTTGGTGEKKEFVYHFKI